MEAARAPKDVIQHPGGGNPDFKLSADQEAEALAQFDAVVAAEVPRGTATLAVITEEDLELERMLERQAKVQAPIDHGPDQPLKKESITRDTLRNYVENYKPASNIMELEEQIHLAKGNDIDSIEATPTLVRHLWKTDFEHIRTKTGYGIYHNIRVYIDGFFEQNKDADKLTMEQKLHGGGQKIDIAPIIRPQKI